MEFLATCGRIFVSIFIKYLTVLHDKWMQIISKISIYVRGVLKGVKQQLIRILDPGSHRSFQANNHET